MGTVFNEKEGADDISAIHAILLLGATLSA
jgi:hypothetical protein